MAATLDGYDVNIGDSVYDVAHGTGKVMELLVENRFRVHFSSGQYFVFDSSGRTNRYPNRTLYWHNPVLMAPLKDDTKWASAAAICRTVAEQLRLL